MEGRAEGSVSRQASPRFNDSLRYDLHGAEGRKANWEKVKDEENQTGAKVSGVCRHGQWRTNPQLRPPPHDNQRVQRP